jgi:hypothetical protein
MGDLISRLKLVSITSCVLSVGVLPALVFLKNGDLPSAQQTTLGGFAFLGAAGSTAALDFVFGPYILTMEQLEKKQKTTDDAEESSNVNDFNHDQDEDDNYPYLLKIQTRSVFGWKNTYIFDPLHDVTTYSGIRPFANFCAKGVPLYAHPELLDDVTRNLIFHASSTTETSDSQHEPQYHHREEGLKKPNNNNNNNSNKDDDFF